MLDIRKNGHLLESNLNLCNLTPHAQPPQHYKHCQIKDRNVVYIINYVWATVFQECL